MDLIDVLVRQSATRPGLEPLDAEQASVKNIIEAARSCYVLPSYCAEMNTDAKKCIHCIVEHAPPPICLEKINEPVLEDFEIEWETAKK